MADESWQILYPDVSNFSHALERHVRSLSGQHLWDSWCRGECPFPEECLPSFSHPERYHKDLHISFQPRSDASILKMQLHLSASKHTKVYHSNERPHQTESLSTLLHRKTANPKVFKNKVLSLCLCLSQKTLTGFIFAARLHAWIFHLYGSLIVGQSEKEKKRLLQTLIVGGGPTGRRLSLSQKSTIELNIYFGEHRQHPEKSDQEYQGY